MTIQRFENGPRMSRVVVHNDTVYLAGLTADATVGQSVAEQTKEILGKIDGLLKAGWHRQVEAPAGDDLAAGHPRGRRVQQGVGRLGGGGLDTGARLHRGAAAIAGEDDRDSGHRGEITLSRLRDDVQAQVQPGMIDRRAAISLLLTLPLAAKRAYAQAYPDRPIRMILPFAPGGVTDVSARYVAQLMSVSLGQSIIIENRSGGGGSIGATAAARAEPDGYTLLVASSATHSILPAMFEKLDYDPISSFAPIAGMSIAPYLLVVNAEVPVTNAGELAAYAKANPASSTLPRPRERRPTSLPSSQGVDRDGLRRRLVPGGAPAMADLMANQVQAIFQPTTIVLPLADDKHVRILGIAANERSSLLPNVPTLAEQGFPQLVANSWNGLVAPASTPEPVIRRLNQVVNDGLDSPGLKSQFAGLGITINGGSPEKFGVFMRDEAIRWDGFVKASKLPKVR